MKKKLIRGLTSVLIIAILAVAGFFLGTQANILIADLDLEEKHLWFPIGTAPEESIVAIAADAGLGYLEGESGKVYVTCTFIYEVDDCWIEGRELPIIDEVPCINSDVRNPPGNIVMKSIQCGWGHYIDITGIALQEDGEVFGYYGQGLSIGQSVSRWFVLSILGATAGIVIGLLIIGKTFPKDDISVHN